MALRSAETDDTCEIQQDFTGSLETVRTFNSFNAETSAMRDRIRDMTDRHAKVLRPMAEDLVKTHGSPVYVVMHGDRVVLIAKTDVEAYDFGDPRYPLGDLSVHLLTDHPKQMSGARLG